MHRVENLTPFKKIQFRFLTVIKSFHDLIRRNARFCFSAPNFWDFCSHTLRIFFRKSQFARCGRVIFSSVSPNDATFRGRTKAPISKPSPAGEGGPLAVDEVFASISQKVYLSPSLRLLQWEKGDRLRWMRCLPQSRR